MISQVVKQEALARLLVEKRIFGQEGVLEMARGVDRDSKRLRKRRCQWEDGEYFRVRKTI